MPLLDPVDLPSEAVTTTDKLAEPEPRLLPLGLVPDDQTKPLPLACGFLPESRRMSPAQAGTSPQPVLSLSNSTGADLSCQSN